LRMRWLAEFVERIEMVVQEEKALSRIGRNTIRQCCPECGFIMEIVDCHKEDGVTFVWYSCSRDGCNGQWLKRISSISPCRVQKLC